MGKDQRGFRRQLCGSPREAGGQTGGGQLGKQACEGKSGTRQAGIPPGRGAKPGARPGRAEAKTWLQDS